MALQPDIRYHMALSVARQKVLPSSACALSKLIYKKRSREPYIENDLSRSLELYENNLQSKLLMEAMLISPNSSTENICSYMDTTKDMVENYKYYFFNVEIFRDKFDICDYISTIEDDKDRITKKMAMQQGFHFIAANFIGGDIGIPPIEVVKRLQTTAYKMIMQANDAVVTSDTAREARAWAGVLKGSNDTILKELEAGGTQEDFVSDFRVMFESKDNVQNITTIDGEVVRG